MGHRVDDDVVKKTKRDLPQKVFKDNRHEDMSPQKEAGAQACR